MNLFPLCTASVWPTKSGVIVLRRDQVLNTFFSFRSLSAWIFTISDGSTYGPFFTLRPILKISRAPCGVRGAAQQMKDRALRRSHCYAARSNAQCHTSLSCPAPFPSPNNEFRRRFLLVPRLLAFDLAPRIRRRPAARALAFAAAERMIDRVHRDAAHPRAAAEPARLPRLADRQQLVLRIADFADRGETLAAHHAHFGRAQAQCHVVAFLRHDLHAGAGAAAVRPAAADLELDVVHRGAGRDLDQRHPIPDADIRAGTGHDVVADVQPLRRQDVALLAVRVMQQGDARGAVRIEFDRRDARRDRELVAPEVDAPVLPLVAAAHVAGRGCGPGVWARPPASAARAATSPPRSS